MSKWAVTLGGYGIAVVLLWLLLMAREDIGKFKEQCNTDKALAVAEAERVARETLESAFRERARVLEAQAERERIARERANVGRTEAEARARSVQLEIDRLIAEAESNGTATLSQECLSVDVDSDILRRMR